MTQIATRLNTQMALSPNDQMDPVIKPPIISNSEIWVNGLKWSNDHTDKWPVRPNGQLAQMPNCFEWPDFQKAKMPK